MRGVFLVLTFFGIALVPFGARAETRIALVIGNSNYAHGRVLTNPANDARRIADALKALGYRLVDDKAEFDLTLSQFRDAEHRFAELGAGADVAVVYYAGHGVEVGGHNYLIPVDARLDTVAAVRLLAVPLSEIVDAASLAGKVRVIILDACRTNDFPLRDEEGGRGGGRGLVLEEAPPRTLVAYAASANQVASDGEDTDSPYTRALLGHIAAPGLDIRRMFDKVLEDVKNDPHGFGQQPMTEDQLGDIDLSIAPSTLASSSSPPAAQRSGASGGEPPDNSADSPEPLRAIAKADLANAPFFLGQSSLAVTNEPFEQMGIATEFDRHDIRFIYQALSRTSPTAAAVSQCIGHGASIVWFFDRDGARVRGVSIRLSPTKACVGMRAPYLELLKALGVLPNAFRSWDDPAQTFSKGGLTYLVQGDPKKIVRVDILQSGFPVPKTAPRTVPIDN